MSTINSERAAYPLVTPNVVIKGVNKREYIAALALQGLLANPNIAAKFSEQSVAQSAISYADALLKQLEE